MDEIRTEVHQTKSEIIRMDREEAQRLASAENQPVESHDSTGSNQTQSTEPPFRSHENSITEAPADSDAKPDLENK
jgi:hypothetical protein